MLYGGNMDDFEHRVNPLQIRLPQDKCHCWLTMQVVKIYITSTVDN